MSPIFLKDGPVHGKGALWRFKLKTQPHPRPESVTVDVRGRNLVTGLPKTITVTSEETEEALKDTTSQIVEAVHSVLEKTPPELAADIADRGIVLTGGGSLLYGLEELIESKTGITTMTAEDPMTAVAIGTGRYVEFLSGEVTIGDAN